MSGKTAKQARRRATEADQRLRDLLRQADPFKPARQVIAGMYRDYLASGHRSMCDTCAFRDGETRLEGRSVCNLLVALADEKPFYCHRDMPVVDGEFKPTRRDQVSTCDGWAMFYTGWLEGDPRAVALVNMAKEVTEGEDNIVRRIARQSDGRIPKEWTS